MNRSIVVVMAHPDDAEIHVGGILLLLRERGHDLHLVTVCRGDVGSMIMSADEIASLRRREAETAARMLGATYDCLGAGDLRVTYNMEIKTAIVEVLRRYDPGAVLTHSPIDYMADHELTAALTREACFAASAPNWPTPRAPELKPTSSIPELYHADPTSQRDAEGRIVRTRHVIDIGTAIERKEALLKCHASQREWLRKQHGEDDYLNSMRDWARVRGDQAGLEFGEGLRQHLGHPFAKSSNLLRSLEEHLHEAKPRSGGES